MSSAIGADPFRGRRVTKRNSLAAAAVQTSMTKTGVRCVSLTQPLRNVSQNTRESRENCAARHSTIGAVSNIAQNYSCGSYAMRPSFTVMSTAKARRVRLYRNGDVFFKGAMLSILPERIRTFDALLSEITRTPLGDQNALPKGVRFIFSVNGTPIRCLSQLIDGESYVCSSVNKFHKIAYKDIVGSTKWNCRSKSTDSDQKLVSNHSLMNKDSFCMEPRWVFVIRSGPRPRTKIRVLLNKQSAVSFDQVLTMFAKAINVGSGIIRQLYNISGEQVLELKDLFQNEKVFVAYGIDKFSSEDLFLDNAGNAN